VKPAILIFGVCVALFPSLTEAQLVRLVDDETSSSEGVETTPSTGFQAPLADEHLTESVAYDSIDNLAFAAADASACSCSTQSGGCNHSCHPSICSRSQLFGDWHGARSGLAAHGVSTDLHLTQFFQGVASGGLEQTFRYGDKLDLYMIAETGKLGLWEGGKLQIHAVDWQFGQNSILDAAGLAPVNLLLLTPETEASFGLTQLFYEHELGAGWELGVGRVNMLDLWTDFYPDWGRGMDGFMNISAVAPLSIDPSLPLITNAAGFLKAGERGMEAAFLVLESQDSPTTVGLDFPNGVALLAALRKYTDFGGLSGSHTLVGTYATGDYTSFDTGGWVIDPPNGVIPAEKSGTWAALYLGEQRLWEDPCDKSRYTKLFGYVGFSDPDNSPFQWTGSLSVEAFGPLTSRPHDRMGLAYFYNALNSDFQNAFSMVSPIGDVQGGEVYYNAQITPWFHLTADIQVVEPSVQAEDTALVLGLRGKVDF
jgi:porin